NIDLRRIAYPPGERLSENATELPHWMSTQNALRVSTPRQCRCCSRPSKASRMGLADIAFRPKAVSHEFKSLECVLAGHRRGRLFIDRYLRCEQTLSSLMPMEESRARSTRQSLE